MGKRLTRTALAGLVGATSLWGLAQAAPPEPLAASQLDWHPWGDQRPADALCRGRYLMPDYRLPAGATPEEVVGSSEQANYGADGEVILGGEVVLRRGTSQLESPRVRVTAERDRALADGPLALRDAGLLVRGEA